MFCLVFVGKICMIECILSRIYALFLSNSIVFIVLLFTKTYFYSSYSSMLLLQVLCDVIDEHFQIIFNKQFLFMFLYLRDLLGKLIWILSTREMWFLAFCIWQSRRLLFNRKWIKVMFWCFLCGWCTLVYFGNNWLHNWPGFYASCVWVFGQV